MGQECQKQPQRWPKQSPYRGSPPCAICHVKLNICLNLNTNFRNEDPTLCCVACCYKLQHPCCHSLYFLVVVPAAKYPGWARHCNFVLLLLFFLQLNILAIIIFFCTISNYMRWLCLSFIKWHHI